MEKTFTHPSGDIELSALITEPEGEARGLVQISHGMIEMKERYLPLMRFLTAHGYVCQIHDHRGHGKSVKTREDLGYLYEKGDEALPKDMLEMANRLRAAYPDKKLCLLGHSMGSLVALSCEKRFDGAFDAILLSGCPAPNPAAAAGLKMVRAMRAFRGDRYRSKTLEKIMFGPYSRKFTPRSPYNWINTDPEEVRLHETDPDMNYSFTLNGYDALLRLMLYDYGKEPFRPGKKDLPILFLAGADDPCIGSPAALEGVAQRLRGDGFTDVTVKTYPGVRHEIFRAPEKQAAFDDALAFLNRAIGD